MEITKEQIKKISDLIGEKQLSDILRTFDPSKIYIIDGYKLHRIGSGSYAFIKLNDSECWGFGSGTAEHQLGLSGDKLMIFDSNKDYIIWAYENSKY